MSVSSLVTQLTVTFLGTGGSMPTPLRNPSALTIQRGGDVLLVDCGEGTQRQLMQSPVRFQAITAIFLSHYHGDHCFGVPGLLKTMALNERKTPLTLYGPKGLQRMVDGFRKIGGWPKEYPIHVDELEPGDTREWAGTTLRVFQGDHSVNNLILRLEEPLRPGKFDRPKAEALGVGPGPMFGKLQRGESVALADGTKITPEMVMGPARKARIVTVSGDTQPCADLVDAARDADLFICEASFLQEEEERAREVQHMCAAEVAQAATEAGVKRVVLTHITPRYKDAEPILLEAQAGFTNCVLAEDLLVLDVPLEG